MLAFFSQAVRDHKSGILSVANIAQIMIAMAVCAHFGSGAVSAFWSNN